MPWSHRRFVLPAHVHPLRIPLYTRFMNIFGTAISEAPMRPRDVSELRGLRTKFSSSITEEERTCSSAARFEAIPHARSRRLVIYAT